MYMYFIKIIVRYILQIHNISYRLAGQLSQYLEYDGLHPKHRLMNYHNWFANHLKKEWNVLDIGCGNGALAYDVKDSCASVFAIDINSQNIKKAKSQFAKKGITYVSGDATRYSFNQKFEAIILSNVLEHIEKRTAFLQQIYSNQNSNHPPILLLRVPMITRDWITLYKKELGVEWRLDSTHFTEYTFKQLEAELEQAGLRIEKYKIQFGEFYGVIKKKL